MAKRHRIHLSGAVVAQDNEPTIGAVLDNLSALCDEVVVVDGGSRDATPEIAASKPGVRLFRRPFDGNISTQKNFALDQCRGEWIFILDTDELLGGRRIRWFRWLTRVPGIWWYSFPRFWLVEQNGELRYLAGKPYYRDRQLRLFRNEPGFRYDTSRSPIHHKFVDKRGLGKPLRHPHIFHYTFLLQSRAEREAKVAKYLGTEPGTAHLHRMYLWEDVGVPTCPVPHGLPGVLGGAVALGKPS